MSEKKKNKKGKKIALAIICFILIACIVLFAVGFNYWKKIQEAEPVVEDTLVYDFDDETIPEKLEDAKEFELMYEGDFTDFKTGIKDWATNGGEIMYDPNVINVLCLGVDTRNQNTVSGLTDSMIIISVNRELGRITMTSIMRDSYAYLESPNGVGSFNKINSAFPFYGVENLIDTIEDHFKIRIDGYATINFALFKAAIDKLGGVGVPVAQYEADYINRVYDFDIKAGEYTVLNGDEALAYCRSRNCDSDGDVSRTRRQRILLTNLLYKFSNVETSEIKGYIETFLPYVKTSYSEAELVSLATKAVVGGWVHFQTEQYVVPDEASRKAHSGDVWYWEVDYPLAAQTMQNNIYGKTNIVLNENRNR